MARQMKPSGLAWLGTIPFAWTMARVKSVCKPAKSPLLNTDTYVGLEHVTSEVGSYSGVSLKETDPTTYQLIDEGTYCFSKLRPYLAKGFIATGPVAASTEFLTYHLHKDVYPSYFLYLSLSAAFIDNLSNVAGGTKMPRINGTLFGNECLPVPGVNEQFAIATFLDDRTTAIDSKIQLLEEKATALADLRKSVIHQAVTKGLDPNVAMKPSGVDWIGDVPGHWDVIKAKSVFAASNSGEVIDKSYWAPGSQTLYTCAKNAMPCTYDTFPSWKRTTGRDLLLTRNATPYIHKPRAGSIYSNVVQRVNLRETVHRDFLGYALQMSADLSLLSEGSTIASLNYSTWCALIFALPPLQQQIEIANQLNSATDVIDESIKTITAQLEALKSLRQSIIHEAVTGKIDVADHGYHYA